MWPNSMPAIPTLQEPVFCVSLPEFWKAIGSFVLDLVAEKVAKNPCTISGTTFLHNTGTIRGTVFLHKIAARLAVVFLRHTSARFCLIL